jgi:hypothetical protein
MTAFSRLRIFRGPSREPSRRRRSRSPCVRECQGLRRYRVLVRDEPDVATGLGLRLPCRASCGSTAVARRW